MKVLFPYLVGVLLLSGCAAPKPPPVSPDAGSMLQPEKSVRPETLLFPEYLLMADFEIGQHGRIPENTLVGADLTTEMNLEDTLQRFDAVLDAHGWVVTLQELGGQSFRLVTARNKEWLEIRAVQGTGVTKVFLLYEPGINSAP